MQYHMIINRKVLLMKISILKNEFFRGFKMKKN